MQVRLHCGKQHYGIFGSIRHTYLRGCDEPGNLLLVPRDAEKQGHQRWQEYRRADSFHRLPEEYRPEIGRPDHHDSGECRYEDCRGGYDLLPSLRLVKQVAGRGLEHDHGNVHDQGDDAEVHLRPAHLVDEVDGGVGLEAVRLHEEVDGSQRPFGQQVVFGFGGVATGIVSRGIGAIQLDGRVFSCGGRHVFLIQQLRSL